MRYLGQEHTVKVPIPAGQLTPESVHEINERFHALHDQTYTFRLDSPVEIVNYHVTMIGLVSKAEIETVSTAGTGMSKAKKEVRPVIFDDFGTLNTTIYDRDSLPIEKVIEGPAVVEESSASTVVFPDQQPYRVAWFI
jgi:N-methylhydantoinase A